MTPNDLGTCEWLVGEIVRARLLERGQLDPLVATFGDQFPNGDAYLLAQYLVEHELLSAFQAERVLDGDARRLVLGPYILVESIGVGSMGSVYRALGRADHRSYAVKVLPLRSLWNVRLARKQVRAFTELQNHPVIVPFLDVGSAIGVHYLVWPFVEGVSLQQRVQEDGPLPYHEVARIGHQLADGLLSFHAKGLFHGLIKPSNVQLGLDGSIHLLDFGIGALLAENIDDEESLIDTISTANATSNMLDCAAPESTIDPTRRNPAGDQYSLGCTLYYALAGQFPFPEGNAVDKMIAHQTQSPTSLRTLCTDIPTNLAGAIECLMQKNPESRFSHLQEFVNLMSSVMRASAHGTMLRPPIRATASGNGNDSSAAPLVKPSNPLPPDRSPPNKGFLRDRPVGAGQDPDQIEFTPPLPRKDGSRRSDASSLNLQREETPPPQSTIQRPEQYQPTPVDPPVARPLPPQAAVPDNLPIAQAVPPEPDNPLPQASTVADAESPGVTAPSNPAAEPAPLEITPVPVATRLNIRLPGPPPSLSIGKKLQHTLFFWTKATEPIQCSVFGTPRVRPGEVTLLHVFCHHPFAVSTVQNLAMSFPPTTFALGADYLIEQLARGTRIAMFADVGGCLIADQLQQLEWQGQPGLLTFQMQVDPQLPAGPLQGLLSIGREDVLIGRIPFQLQVVA